VNRGVVTAVAFYILCKINGFAKPILFKTKPVFDFDLKEREEVNEWICKTNFVQNKTMVEDSFARWNTLLQCGPHFRAKHFALD